jgi:hypothetical protein
LWLEKYSRSLAQPDRTRPHKNIRASAHRFIAQPSEEGELYLLRQISPSGGRNQQLAVLPQLALVS